MSMFECVQQAANIEVFALSQAFDEDTSPNKVNLTVGAYRTDEGLPYVLPVVRTVESQMASDVKLTKEYLPIPGMPEFCAAAVKLVLGDGHEAIVSKRADGVQCLGGTGALRLAMDFMAGNMQRKIIYVSNPTWGNHKLIAKRLGMEVREYRYWSIADRAVDMAGLTEDLSNAPEGAVVILHGVAHNPTGMDPTKEQWETIAQICETRRLFPLFDVAYQGFASGDLDEDAYAVRLFAQRGFEMFVAQSFSKNFGLYNERVGNLAVLTKSAEVTGRLKSQLRLVVRTMWSNPPNHGGRIVATVLNNAALRAEWQGIIVAMTSRIKLMRKQLSDQLRTHGTPGSWAHIQQQIGMFSYTGLTARQAAYLKEKYHIYLMSDGRVNMCGLNSKNIDYVGAAVHDAVVNVTD